MSRGMTTSPGTVISVIAVSRNSGIALWTRKELAVWWKKRKGICSILSELLCALIFPKCQRNICGDLERTFLFTQNYNTDERSCNSTVEKSPKLFDPLMPETYPNGEFRRKSEFNCSGLPASRSTGISRFYTKSIVRRTGVNHEECKRRVKTLFHFKDWIYVERYLTCLITLHGSSSMKIYKIV